MTALVNALDSHLRAKGHSSIDAYCSGIGATVCQEFADYYKAIKGVDIDEEYIQYARQRIESCAS
jgi:tRNA/tmRNA/rRNA uracil-C5-methylase (TrmA/RlmC/RlmD family)